MPQDVAVIKPATNGMNQATTSKYATKEGAGPEFEPRKLVMISAVFIGGVFLLNVLVTIVSKIRKSE
eukprot:gnl/Chilomastix_caulleri/1319.p1 GENE.gnl/Chilomastix_caulleri/1319~~gnl/Chilomastix_caulleri/1319.p1  ORF type:complete len:67 (+),score=12.29 gnl/Chilomastix_caulleri/1319:73-273(+)